MLLFLMLEPVDEVVNPEAVLFHQSVETALNVCILPDSVNSFDLFFHFSTPPGLFFFFLRLKNLFLNSLNDLQV